MDIKYMLKEAKYYKKKSDFFRALKKFILTQTALSKKVNSPLYNKIYSRIIKNKAKRIEPIILQIENTNLCNAKCMMCPHIIMKRKCRIMKQEEFEKIADNVMKYYPIKRVVITGFGEPFIDQGITNKIEYINKNYPKAKIEIYTNASLLDKKMTDELLKKNIQRITFSINGTEKNYKKIMDLDYNKTKDNVLYFLEQNKTAEKPTLVNISLMILKDNEEDIKEFIEFWKPLADSVRAYPPSDWAGGIKKKGIIQKTQFNSKRWPCFVLWNNITIDVDGNVILCHRDYESKEKFGNLLKEDIKEIRNSKRYKDLLEKQLNFDFKTPICSTCDNSFDSSLDWIC